MHKRNNPHLNITMPPETLARLDDFRWNNRIPSRSAAIAILIDLGLDLLEDNPDAVRDRLAASRESNRD